MPEQEFDRSQMERKPYTPPEISHEMELETRAGSPIGGAPGDLFDPGQPVP